MSFFPIAVIAYIIYQVVKKAKASGGLESLMKEIHDAQNKNTTHPKEESTYEYDEYDEEYDEEDYPREFSPRPIVPIETPQKFNNLLKESASSSITPTNKVQKRSKPQVKTDLNESSVYATEKTAYRIKSEEDLKRAFVWSEIFNRKYN